MLYEEIEQGKVYECVDGRFRYVQEIPPAGAYKSLAVLHYLESCPDPQLGFMAGRYTMTREEFAKQALRVRDDVRRPEMR
ncbi:hypothetical protein Theco_4092 (plasmid) [Thermobacillus composti KWC4]|uniref:Uncharacterized protein n=2 Tax=Thermobacillus TaxID=76632 RepID=L0EJX1_THECK|nr:hypothetical protein Theco_4092 [Thermobacillus composti KWC4]